jgi:hypothetical protein
MIFLNKRYDIFDKSEAIRNYTQDHAYSSSNENAEVFSIWQNSVNN